MWTGGRNTPNPTSTDRSTATAHDVCNIYGVALGQPLINGGNNIYCLRLSLYYLRHFHKHRCMRYEYEYWQEVLVRMYLQRATDSPIKRIIYTFVLLRAASWTTVLEQRPTTTTTITVAVRTGPAKALLEQLIGYAPLSNTNFDILFWHGVPHVPRTFDMPSLSSPVLLRIYDW